MGGTRSSSSAGAGVVGSAAPAVGVGGFARPVTSIPADEVAQLEAKFPRVTSGSQAISVRNTVERLLKKRLKEGPSQELDELILNTSSRGFSYRGSTFLERREVGDNFARSEGASFWLPSGGIVPDDGAGGRPNSTAREARRR